MSTEKGSIKASILYQVLLIFIIGLFLLSGYVVHKVQDTLRLDAEVIDIAGKNRMLSQRAAFLATQITDGDDIDKELLVEVINEHDFAFYALKNGGAVKTPYGVELIPRSPDEFSDSFTEAEVVWVGYKDILNEVVSGSKTVDMNLMADYAEKMLTKNYDIVVDFVALSKQKQQRFERIFFTLLIIDVLALIGSLFFARKVFGLLIKKEVQEKESLSKLSLSEGGLLSKTEDLEKQKLAMLNVLEDIELEKDKQEKLASELLKFKQAVDNATDMIIITDAKGLVIYANEAVHTLTGYNPSEAVGKKAAELWKTPMPKSYYEDMWDTIKNKKQTFRSQLVNKRKDGTTYDAEVSISPVLDSQGEARFFVGIERDISQEKEHERTSLRLQIATQSAVIGIWEWDVKNNVLTWDENMYKLYGIQKDGQAKAYEAWQNGLHPEDKEAGDRAVKDALSGKAKFDTEFRVVWPNGQIHYIKAAAEVLRDKKGEPECMVGVNWDITHDKEVDKAKSEFVSLASHQLRTPLSSINWYAEMLIAGDAGPLTEDQKKYLDEIYKGNQRMVDLVNSLLNVSRLELGTFIVEPEQTNVIALAKSVMEEQMPQLTKKKQQLSANLSDDVPSMYVDPKLLRMVLQNLLSNSIKYTNEEGRIEVDMNLDEERKNLKIKVADTGMGIPKQQQSKVFSKLFRADNVRETDTEGTGLGLYIVKQVIEHSGGTVTFNSPYVLDIDGAKKEVQGTAFYITLPLSGMKARKGTKSID